ncbi:MAG TPA: hypothetical protein DIT64_03045, partial [Verrucomicrobiales bacterium]|nr:hypothetical protein [Verrucomicrobiales bacterium]
MPASGSMSTGRRGVHGGVVLGPGVWPWQTWGSSFVEQSGLWQPHRQQMQSGVSWVQLVCEPQPQLLLLQGVWISSQTVVHGFWPLTLGPQEQLLLHSQGSAAQLPGQLAGQLPPLSAQPQLGVPQPGGGWTQLPPQAALLSAHTAGEQSGLVQAQEGGGPHSPPQPEQLPPGQPVVRQPQPGGSC